MNKEQAKDAVLLLAREGWLIGVEVFGTDDCCLHGDDPCPSDGFGLCDAMHEPVSWGSDCNRAERFLLRPHDDLMTAELASAIEDNW